MQINNRKRVFLEVFGAIGVAVGCFSAGYAARPASGAWVGTVSAASNAEEPLPEWLLDFLRGYISLSEPDDYAQHYADFVKPYYGWAGGATRDQIRDESERYKRAYDVAELELLLVSPLTPVDDFSAGVHEFLLTCRRLRKHRGKDDMAREIVRVGITINANPQPPEIVGVRTIDPFWSDPSEAEPIPR